MSDCTFVLVGKFCSVKKGGPNPLSNTALAVLIEKDKELDVPKDIVERNIKKASEKGQEAFIEKVYEVTVLTSHYISKM